MRSASRELVTIPTAAVEIAEGDVVRSRQAVSIRSVNAGRSTVVYMTGTLAKVADSVGTVLNDCV